MTRVSATPISRNRIEPHRLQNGTHRAKCRYVVSNQTQGFTLIGSMSIGWIDRSLRHVGGATNHHILERDTE